MSSFFHQNNYPETVTDSALERVKKLSQEDALLPVDRSQTNSRIPFTLTYHPLNDRIKKIIYNNFRILQEDSHTKDIFEAPPLMAFRRDKNIKDTLVRTNLKTNDPPGTFPCNHHLCQTYKHINNSTTVTNGNRNFTIRSAFTCASSSVVYCITCTKCNILYIGETSRQINNRFGEHLRNVRNRTHLVEQHENDPDSNISHHFNLPNHSTDDMSILGLLYASTESTKRKTLEKRIIFALGTLYPSGLNKHFVYLQ